MFVLWDKEDFMNKQINETEKQLCSSNADLKKDKEIVLIKI